MQYARFPTVILNLLFSFTLLAYADDSSSISGCGAVACSPDSGNSTTTVCRVGNDTLDMLGITTFTSELMASPPGEPATPLDLAWTVGIQGARQFDIVNTTQRLIQREYYLGTPPQLNLSSDSLQFSGCAFFIAKNGNRTVGAPSSDFASASTACDEYIGTQCLDALEAVAIDAARNLDNFTPPRTACPDIARTLRRSLPRECSWVSEKSINITGVALTGANSSRTLDRPENLTAAAGGDCWPTIPQTNNLTRVFGYDVTVPLNSTSENVNAAFGYTPILTLFYPNQQGSNPLASSTCLRPVSNSSVETARDSGGGRTGISLQTIVGAVALGLFACGILM